MLQSKLPALSLFLLPFLVAAAAPTTMPTTTAGWVAWRDAILKSAPTAPLPRDAFASTMIKSHQPLLTDTDPNARLNSAILFAQFETLSSDAVLMDMLKNPDPAVRLWALKGLASLATPLKKAGSTRAVTALKTALAAEKDDTVKSEITKTLAAY